MPKTGLEPARLSALAPETSASTIPPLGQVSPKHYLCLLFVDAKLYIFIDLCKFFNDNLLFGIILGLSFRVERE